MNKILALSFLLITNLNAFSQEEYIKLPHAKTQNPTYIYNFNIIGSEKVTMILGLPEIELNEEINDISILKDKQNRNLNNYYNLTEYGMLFIDLKKEIPSKTQSELNEFFGLNKETNIYVDGYLVEHKNYKISLVGLV